MHSLDTLARFWVKVDIAGPDDCWLWTAATTCGYGRIRVAGKIDMAHRISYEIANGSIPDQLVVDHLCFERACVNPAHLRLLTRAENAGRHSDRCPCSACHPEKQRLDICSAGHDLTAPGMRNKIGRCRTCQNRRNREHMRRVRAVA